MTKKHYDRIASIIKINRANMVYSVSQGYISKSAIECNTSLINTLTDYLESENPKFNRARFLAACGIYPVMGTFDKNGD